MFGQPAPAPSAVLLYPALHAQECRWRWVPSPWEVPCLVNQPTSDQHLSSANGGFWLHIGYVIRQSGPGVSSVSRKQQSSKVWEAALWLQGQLSTLAVLLKPSVYSYSVTDLKKDPSFKALECSQQGNFLWQWPSSSSSQMTLSLGSQDAGGSPKHYFQQTMGDAQNFLRRLSWFELACSGEWHLTYFTMAFYNRRVRTKIQLI